MTLRSVAVPINSRQMPGLQAANRNDIPTILPARLEKNDQVHFRGNSDTKPEAPTVQPDPEHTSLLTSVFNRIAGFFNDIWKAVRKLFGLEPPKPISKVIGKNLGKAIAAREQDPAFQQAMIETGEVLERMSFGLEAQPDMQAHLKEQAALLKSPEGRQFLMGNTVHELVQAGHAERAIQAYPEILQFMAAHETMQPQQMDAIPEVD